MRTSRRPLFLLLPAAVLSFASCSGGDDDDVDTDTSVDGGGDGESDGSADADSDTPEPDASDDDGADIETSDDVSDEGGDADAGLTPCGEGDTCADGFLCVEGFCESLACGRTQNWVQCQNLFNRLGDERGRYAVCSNGQCRESCYYDTDCTEGQICTDFGRCTEFTGTFVDPPAAMVTGTLQAGVANRLMNFPVGVPLGGYGQRAAFNDGRYAVSLKASVGTFEGFYARAVVVDNGENHLMVMRLPVIFTSMATHELVARALQERTGKDWRNSLVVSSTHTHSGPCRHWHLPVEAAAPLGSFGIGEFHQWFYELINELAIETALAAIDDMQPAKIGWHIEEAYDVDDNVANDRWSQSPPFDDNRVLLLRIDDLENVPRAVLFSFGMHGTDNDSDFATNDVIGAAEHALEVRLAQQYDRYIPTLFINQNSGTMGPSSGAGGHGFPMGREHLGLRFVEKIFDPLVEMETTTELSLFSRAVRFPIGYDELGYERGQFGADVPPPFGGEYHFGGLSCVGTFGGDDDYATHQVLENLSCAGGIHFLLYNHPPTTLTRSQITAIQLNGLSIVTMPGELSQELSWQILRALRDRHGVDPMNAWTWGYANDHLFYLLPTNLRGDDPPFPGQSTPQPIDSYPDFAFSFLQGGYESTMSMWGPNQGDFLVQRALDAYELLVNPSFVPPLPQPLPDQYADRPYEPFPVDVTPDDRAGEIVQQVPATVQRLDTIEFAWIGGDPGAEMPQTPLVTLERNIEGFFDVQGLDLQPYNNRGPYFITRLRQPEPGAPWEWVVRWEEVQTFETGTYRFRVDGHLLNEAGERVPYTVHSAEFELVPNAQVIVTAEVVDGVIRGTAGFPPDVRGRFVGPGADPGRVSGNYRMRHPRVPTGLSAPLETLTADGVTLTAAGNPVDATVTVTTADETIGGRSVPVTRFEISGLGEATGDTSVVIQVVDALGNSGAFEGTLTF